MRRRSRTRRVLKWVGTVACVCLLLVFAASLFWHAEWSSDGHLLHVYLNPGEVEVAYFPSDDGTTLWESLFPRGDLDRHFPPEFYVYSKYSDAGSFDDWHASWRPWFFSDDGFRQFVVPLWLLFLLAAIPTAYLWWHDRGYRPHACQSCGYDLTGNVSGTCPECGEPTKAVD